ncbi:MAG: hypothetical protein ACI8T1_004850 [Verrucomicrobiales bacterium]|jgi:hypothetical protein
MVLDQEWRAVFSFQDFRNAAFLVANLGQFIEFGPKRCSFGHAALVVRDLLFRALGDEFV